MSEKIEVSVVLEKDNGWWFLPIDGGVWLSGEEVKMLLDEQKKQNFQQMRN